jgi:uncharacterized protein (UPF0210 family)
MVAGVKLARSRAGRGEREEKGAVLEERGGAEFLSPDNEACLAWLADAVERVRLEGQMKVAGYLEAVLEEVAFEIDATPRSQPSAGGV